MNTVEKMANRGLRFEVLTVADTIVRGIGGAIDGFLERPPWPATFSPVSLGCRVDV